MGSEMCIRDRVMIDPNIRPFFIADADAYRARLERLLAMADLVKLCLLYTSDAADERSSVDLGGRRIIKKKKIDY